MDLHLLRFTLLLFLSLLSVHTKVIDGAASVFFLDSPTHNYLRPSSPQSDSMLLPEVGAAVSVLLGFAPPATLSAASSSKLNEVLMPNPFHRPRAVLMLEVTGAEGAELVADSDNHVFTSALRSKVIVDEETADIQLSDENEVSLFSLNEPSSLDECTEDDLNRFASWLGGSYVSDSAEPLNGELIIPLSKDAHLKLHLSKKAERQFTLGLVSLIRKIVNAMELHVHVDSSGRLHKPAELITGKFDGLTALQEFYGTEGIAQQGKELFVTAVSKIFDALQAAYKGQIVGVVVCNGTPLPQSETMLNAVFISQPSARWLEETTGPPNATAIAEVVLVRRVLAWLTGIILLIATLIGIYFLLNMPLTKDTLLYSNVKLD